MNITFNTYNEFLKVSKSINEEMHQYQFESFINETVKLYNEMNSFINDNIIDLDYFQESEALLSDKKERRDSIFVKIQKFIESIVNKIKSAIESLINKKSNEVLEKQNAQLEEMKQIIQKNEKKINDKITSMNHRQSKIFTMLTDLNGINISNAKQLNEVVNKISSINKKLDGMYAKQELLASTMVKVNGDFSKLKENISTEVHKYFDKALAAYELTQMQINKINNAIDDGLAKNVLTIPKMNDSKIDKFLEENKDKINKINKSIEKIDFDKLNQMQNDILSLFKKVDDNLTSLNYAAKANEKNTAEIKSHLYTSKSNENIIKAINSNTNQICDNIKSFNNEIIKRSNIFWQGLQFIDKKITKDDFSNPQEAISKIKNMDVDSPDYSQLAQIQNLSKTNIVETKEKQLAKPFNGGSKATTYAQGMTNFATSRLSNIKAQEDKKKLNSDLLDFLKKLSPIEK